ncbi:type II toxin-antitoxin system death-on-curing family toxin [Paraburkholderia bengalensis]|uniref:Type II toxin-antitoxin system death-on-curing family toxin n=1 Tax=Paraburkholderia bengalensis TaxID=2747562 RepID=A0ABU8IL89_9BURK
MRRSNTRVSDTIRFIDYSDVISIHEQLAADMANTEDAISPVGVKSDGLLHSAVGRQHAGFSGSLKYSSIESNAATLAYGICCNHPFHNGNKRTALVSMLCHLDKNDRTFDTKVTQDDLYNLMRDIAAHRFATDRGGVKDKSDEEIEKISTWLRKRVRRVERNERLLTFRELRTILQRYGFLLENLDGNKIDVIAVEQVTDGFWFFKTIKESKRRVIRIGWPRDGAVVARQLLKDIREACQLTEENGIDSRMFYASERPVDYFIHSYRGVLRRLAKT